MFGTVSSVFRVEVNFIEVKSADSSLRKLSLVIHLFEIETDKDSMLELSLILSIKVATQYLVY